MATTDRDVPSTDPTITVEERIEELRKRKKAALTPGGRDAAKKQHDRGKLTARERLEILMDKGSFVETDPFAIHRAHDFGMEKKHPPGDGVITGYGTIDGRKVFVSSQDFTVFGGSMGEVMAQKVCKVMDLAISTGAPFISINDSGGARIQEGAASLAGYGYIFERNVRASGVIPQISVIMGPCAGGAVYSPAITDFTFMVKETSHMFITGPDVIKTVTGEEVTMEELGRRHDARRQVRRGRVRGRGRRGRPATRALPAELPARPTTWRTRPPTRRPTTPTRLDEGLTHIVPGPPAGAVRHARGDPPRGRRRRVPRDLPAVGDEHRDRLRAPRRPHGRHRREPAEGASPARSTSTPARRRRGSCGSATRSTSRSSRSSTCPGSCRARTQEYNGIIRHGAKLLYAYAEATVPRMTVITRKAYGGAYLVMNSKHLRADVSFAWPTAEIAVMGAEGAVNVVFRREIEKAADPAAKKAELIDEYRREVLHARTRRPSAASSTT